MTQMFSVEANAHQREHWQHCYSQVKLVCVSRDAHDYKEEEGINYLQNQGNKVSGAIWFETRVVVQKVCMHAGGVTKVCGAWSIGKEV